MKQYRKSHGPRPDFRAEGETPISVQMFMVPLVAIKMLTHHPARLVLSILGIAFAFFLAAAQIGLMVGWCMTCSAIVRHSEVDLWVMKPRTPAFDYGTAMPRHRIYQVRSVDGVQWAEGMFVAWNTWQTPEGRQVNVQLVGLDESCVGSPWEMVTGKVEQVHWGESVIVDELFLGSLGVSGVGDEVSMYGTRARVVGISRGIRTLTASPFVFSSIKSAVRYDHRYSDDEITYVLARCAPGANVRQVRDRILRNVPNVEALTTREFATRTMRYWMLETGLGITVVITAILGLFIGGAVISQTLYTTTHENLNEYAMLAALGFDRLPLSCIVVLQGLLMGACGILLGSASYFAASYVSQRTPIPIESTRLIYAGLIGLFMAFCPAAGSMSIRAVFHVDPQLVFKR